MKPGVFSQIYLHLVFSPKHREPLLSKDIRAEVFSHMSGTITNKGHKSININGVEDHVHILIGFNPSLSSINDLVRDIKKSSSFFINEKKWCSKKFAWQEGYGAFSYGHSQLERIYQYIENQEEHHKKKTFREEYIQLLEKYEISYNEKFLFVFEK
jgi:putative transposase